VNRKLKAGLALSEGRQARVEGFTLVELLAALAIFLVVVSASYALFDGGRRLAARGEYHARRFQSARSALRAIESDLRAVFTGGAYDGGFFGRQDGTDELPLDSIDAVAYNHQPKLATPKTAGLAEPAPKEFDVSRVTWSIDYRDDTKASGLVRRRVRLVSRVDTVDDPEEGLEEIAPDIVGLRFRYYDGNDWMETWDSTATRSLPRLIEVTVHVKGVYREEQEIEPFSMKFSLPLGGSR
jgi:type II secretion system protein J